MKKETTGEIIKYARNKKGLSQQKLAEKLNVTRQAVSNWENDLSYPDQSIIVKLCKILEIEPKTIYNDIITNDIELFIKKDEKKQINYNILNLLLIILIIIGLLFLITRKTFEFYTLHFESKYFKMNNAYLIYSNKENYFNIGTIESNVFNTDNIKIIIFYKENNNIIDIYNDEYKPNSVIKLKNNKSLIKNINNLYIEIYYEYRNEFYNEQFKLHSKKEFDKEGIVETNIENYKDINNKYKLKIETLVNNGYTYNKKTKTYQKYGDFNFEYDIENNIFTLSTGTNKDIIYAKKYYNDNYIKIGYSIESKENIFVTIYYNDSIIKFNEDKEFNYTKYLNELNKELTILESN